MENLFQKRRRELAKKKLEMIKKLFEKLETKLSAALKTKSKRVLTLEKAAQIYSIGTDGAKYDGCVLMYKLFHIGKKNYPSVCEEAKVLLRAIASKHFQIKDRSQLSFPTETKLKKPKTKQTSIQASLF
jgi:hypothetical protein